ncbi:hypothetical protein PENTCL1PPCAC_29937 [Pristionchus entomophagus]|uniref:C2H2-type domain-containing protein n=1 Tax=Pristionchus entomophagus TaxID=358040 RepID=A0AAV5UNM4_9BILA|nr:hypothetical protein PENTCL1PPCAC_29937 [Pristionchus entomophagus]
MDNNCCAECGYTTTNMLAFTSHITQHEEDQKTVKTEWSSVAELLSPTSSPPLSSALSMSEADQIKRLRLLSNLPPLDGLMTAPSSNGSDEEKMICSSSSSSGSVSPNEGEITTITAAAQLLLAKTQEQVQMPLTSATVKKSNKAMHVCPHCNFTTFMSQHMKSHLEAHERHQGQMYQCDICQMQFSQKANMHRHRMRHSGVKPYECRYCKKRFFRKDQMQEHSMTHIKTGADFDCPVAGCPLQFGQHSVLRAHLDEAHQITSGTPASCKRCSLLFSNSRRLLLHYQTKHDEGDTSGINVTEYSECGDESSPTSSPPKKRRASLAPSAPSTPATLPTMMPTPAFIPTSAASFFGGGGAAPSLLPAAAAAAAAAAAVNPMALLQARLEEMAKMYSLQQQVAAAHQVAAAAAAAQQQQPFQNGLLAPKLERYSPDSEGSTMSNEDLLLVLSNQAQTSLFGMHDSKSIWPSATESVSNMTATASDDASVHSPSVDSNHSATELDEDLAKEQQECTHCDISFKDKTLYLLHKGLHSELEPWKCNLCGHNCGDKYMFTTHVISVDHSV